MKVTCVRFLASLSSLTISFTSRIRRSDCLTSHGIGASFVSFISLGDYDSIYVIDEIETVFMW